MRLNEVYSKLLSHYGPQQWWPGDTQFEITIGAILTQNVSWGNVQKAIAHLKERNLLYPQRLFNEDMAVIAQCIKPSGYYNQKAYAVTSFLKWFKNYDFSFDELQKIETLKLRSELLSLPRIGPETADSILLYALERKIFVVDAYTKKMFTRIGVLSGKETYDAVQKLFHEHFSGCARDYNEFHALIVRHGKYLCTKMPVCAECCIALICRKNWQLPGAH